MKQSKKDSFIEALSNTGIAFIITVVMAYPIYWVFGIEANFLQISGSTIAFTIVSVVRNYFVRRIFNNKYEMKKPIKRTLTGEGISGVFNNFPADLEIGKTYELIWDFELRDYLVMNKYKAASFDWNKPIR